ncbi:hypothetical protein [Actinomadura harenae]|uniref:Uncharacterized protein n=1 Tax=Actinomadura harenae TaxID=2483351 RepID=A0A3M2MAM5_9ACTN|nr:hypothetical protein [Actinomadura harenae]RMI46596.1 hypothetical protein EBO15_06630 [Actinomadura harenae]
MPLATITLTSGRQVALNNLEISSTNDGLLEGYPCALLNDRLLASLARGPETPYRTSPRHVITPERHYPDRGTGSSLPFGPVEELPAFHCRGSFTSTCVDPNLDEVLHRSRLTVIWFQHDLATPVPDFAATAIADLPWNDLAEDYEL